MTESPDRKLGLALRELEVPEHARGFDQELRRRLAEPRPRRRTWVLAAAAAVAFAAAVSGALFLPRGSDVASAAQVRAAVTHALESTGTISGVFVNQEQARGGENRWRFVLDSSGSFRITGMDGNPTETAYDAEANVEDSSDLGLFVRRTGLAPGWPDSGPADWVVQRGLGSVVAALAVSGDAEVEEIELEAGSSPGERPAWRLRTSTGNPGEERVITVDRETGIPVRDARLENGRPAGAWWIEELAVDRRSESGAFRLEPARGDELRTYDMGFRRVDLEEAGGIVGYRPLVPTWVPDGFEQDRVAVAESSRPTGDEQGPNPPSREVVSLAYRRGLDRIVITTRLTGSDPSEWGDPVIGSSVRAGEPERVRFEAGALAGHSGELVVDPSSVPHVWAVAGPLVVTVAGNAGRDELLRIAESLRGT